MEIIIFILVLGILANLGAIIDAITTWIAWGLLLFFASFYHYIIEPILRYLWRSMTAPFFCFLEATVPAYRRKKEREREEEKREAEAEAARRASRRWYEDFQRKQREDAEQRDWEEDAARQYWEYWRQSQYYREEGQEEQNAQSGQKERADQSYEYQSSSQENTSRSNKQRKTASRNWSLSYEQALVILGLQEEFTQVGFKKAYRKAMMATHPDRGGTKEQAQKVNEARDLVRHCNNWH